MQRFKKKSEHRNTYLGLIWTRFGQMSLIHFGLTLHERLKIHTPIQKYGWKYNSLRFYICFQKGTEFNRIPNSERMEHPAPGRQNLLCLTKCILQTINHFWKFWFFESIFHYRKKKVCMQWSLVMIYGR